MSGHCRDCRFWREGTHDDMGDCRLFSDDSTLDESDPRPPESLTALLVTLPFAGADGAVVITDPSFGCVQFDQKGGR